MSSGIITLLTDFGTSDPFVGVMKGVVLGRFPGARLIDLTHAAPPQDIVFGAFWLERSARWFPPGTVHVAVVDPGVGTERRALACRAGDQYFVGPDNGLLGAALESAAHVDVRALDLQHLQRLGLSTPSRTFHGRDVFAPVAAELARGRWALDALGPAIGDFVRSPLEKARKVTGEVHGEVVVVDHFGNLMTNIDAASIAGFASARVEIAGKALALVGTYGEIGAGEVAALIDAFDVVEISARDGSAFQALGVGRGATVRVC